MSNIRQFPDKLDPVYDSIMETCLIMDNLGVKNATCALESLVDGEVFVIAFKRIKGSLTDFLPKEGSHEEG